MADLYERPTPREIMESHKITYAPVTSMGDWYCIYCGRTTEHYGQDGVGRMWCRMCHHERR